MRLAARSGSMLDATHMMEAPGRMRNVTPRQPCSGWKMEERASLFVIRSS
jgi:hypothetical protein